MSRRKQSNPKPLLKSDCQETGEDMTVEKESKDLTDVELSEDNITSDTEQTEDPSDSTQHSQRTESESPPYSVPKIEISNKRNHETSPPFREVFGNDGSSPQPSVLVSNIATITAAPRENLVPKLRLNLSLASDPALKPDAKEVKILTLDHDDLKTSDEPVIIQKQLQQHHPSKQQRQQNLKSPVSGSVQDGLTPRVQIFMCHPCGIRFSSLSTLEAHQTYYCSHRKEVAVEEDVGSNMSVAAVTDDAGLASAPNANEPSVKSIKSGKQYACTHCSYSADKKVSLNRHMRMHQTSPAPSSNTSNGENEASSSPQIDRYCTDCDIRFSNIKTYRAHKQHYCSSRRTDTGSSSAAVAPATGISTNTKPESSRKSGSSSPQERSRTPSAAAVVTSVSPPQPFLALPTNPILIIPYSLIRAASLLPGPLTSLAAGVENPDATCFTFENGALVPLATMLTNHSLNNNSASTTSRMQTTAHHIGNNSLLTEKNSKTRMLSSQSEVPSAKTVKRDSAGIARESAPLDLTVRKSPTSFQFGRSDRISPDDTNRIDIDVIMEGKENLLINAGRITPEQIVCAPSLPNSPSLSPSPKRRTISPKVDSRSVSISPGPLSAVNPAALRQFLPPELALKLSESNLLGPLLQKQNELAYKAAVTAKIPSSSSTENQRVSSNSPAASASILNLPNPPLNVVPPMQNQAPQIYVKQGVSKCKECNIVFCKYENYLAHKQHYCSARNQDEGNGEKKAPSNSPPNSKNNPDGGHPPLSYHQLICAACGIKYTSLDNLRAHQTFYCPKGGGCGGGDLSTVTTQITISSKEKCSKCKMIHDHGQTCTSTLPATTASSSARNTTSQNSYKCPVCDAANGNALELRKHLETHGSVKAFRCSICRYKGNTLRGMRTHIKMHFDKKSNDLNEENYMSCILEDDGSNIEVPIPIPPVSASNALPVEQQQFFKCEICTYSSTYKGNVFRHMKLVHLQSQSISPTTSPEVGEGGESLKLNGGESADQKSLEPSTVIVKTEPLDVHQTDTAANAAEEDIMVNIKAEPGEDITPQHHKDVPPSSLQGHGNIPVAATGTISPCEDNSNNINKSNAGAPKYCETCDIKFNYMNTYLAHKQFYCKSSAARIDKKSPSPNSQSPSMINKPLKENLEQTVL